MKNTQIRKMGLIDLVDLKREKERVLWTLGFRLAPRELFDTLVEIDKEIELKVEQIIELSKVMLLDLVPNITEQELQIVRDAIEDKKYQEWLDA